MELDIWHYWYAASLALLILEAFLIPGIGFFFAAIASLIMGVLVQTGMLPADDLLVQGGIFFFMTAVIAVALWKPLRKMRVGRGQATHNDMIGRHATVGDQGLVKGKRGHAKWSGAIMNAKLADDADMDNAEAGTELKIVNMQGSTLILAQENYVITTEE